MAPREKAVDVSGAFLDCLVPFRAGVCIHLLEQGNPPMMELKVDLSFACYHCELPVGVTVVCQGKCVFPGSRSVAAVNVPCPHCSSVNQLYFEPSGQVRGVAPYKSSHYELEPSVN
jgi:hypothetical protein